MTIFSVNVNMELPVDARHLPLEILPPMCASPGWFLELGNDNMKDAMEKTMEISARNPTVILISFDISFDIYRYSQDKLGITRP